VTRIRCRPTWALAVLGLTFAACGAAAGPSRLDLKTPGVNTGAPLPATPVPTARPDVTPAATPGNIRKPVTKSEKRIIRAWADELRHGRVSAASRYFAIPSLVSNETPSPDLLRSRADVEQFNRALPCGAKLIRTRRGAEGFVVGIFKLTERPGAGECGAGTGQVAAVAFLIEDDHIASWVRVATDTAAPDPTPTPTPTATATASPTASPEPRAAPGASVDPRPTGEAGVPAWG
jgi:hypothetical protein